MGGVFAVVISIFLSAIAFASGDAGRGKAVYERHCQHCHGRDGAGDGPASGFLNPPPRDFTSGIYKWKTTPFDEMSPSDDDFKREINGRPSHNSVPGWDGLDDTAMPGWSDVLGDNDIRDVVGYLKKLSGIEAPEAVHELKVKIAPSKNRSRAAKRYSRTSVRSATATREGDGGKSSRTTGRADLAEGLTKPWTFRAGSAPVDIYARVTVRDTRHPDAEFADPQSKRRSRMMRWDVANYAASLAAPYKKPGEAVIKAVKIEGALPDAPGTVGQGRIRASISSRR